MAARDDRDYPPGESTDARFQRWLVDHAKDQRIRPEGQECVTLAGHELYDLLHEVAEWSYWKGVDDVRRR